MMKTISFYLLLVLHVTKADINWPQYNQQCQDDAGSPYLDDEENFPNGFYHDNSAASPVLLSDGSCAKPMQDACSKRPNPKVAYLEGPIDCGDNGWYCRIVEQDGWNPINLIADLNFGHCNSTNGFDDAGYDRDGHCHGSSHDSTYYWWIRDHWHRQYNGRLRCCCGWYEGSSEPLYGRRIANRCDYRRLVTQQEDVSECRDANEDHGLGFDDIGCNPSFEDQIGQPIPENDDICWEIHNFGYTEEEYEPTPTPPTPTPPTPTPPSPTPPSGDGDCEDSAVFKFRILKDAEEEKYIWRDCEWVANKPGRRCYLDDDAAQTTCPSTCDTCDDCVDATGRLRFWKGNRYITRDCGWVANKPGRRCNLEGVAEACRDTCGLC